MNKKGFTLVEVLGVMVIIVTLSLIILPNIINRFSNKKEDISKVDKELIVSAAKLYVSDKKEELSDYLTYCVDINELIKNKYLSEKKDVFSDNDYASNHKVKVTIGKPNEYEVVESSSCKSLTPYDTGNKIKVAGIDFYIISNHDDYVVALKAEPLTVDEVNQYGGVGTEDNHVNKNSCMTSGTAYDLNDSNHSGGMAYYSDSRCGGCIGKFSACKSGYSGSDIKFAVDNWAADKFKNNILKDVEGYKARLVEIEELRSQFYSNCISSEGYCDIESETPSWLYNLNYNYWTMTSRNYYSTMMVGINGNIGHGFVYSSSSAVRPVINVYKSAIDEISAQ